MCVGVVLLIFILSRVRAKPIIRVRKIIRLYKWIWTLK